MHSTSLSPHWRYLPTKHSLRFAMWDVLYVVLLLCLAATRVGCNQLCVGTICGNKQFLSAEVQPGVTAVKILVYSVWVGEPLEVNRLNHKIYCDLNGYEYRHFNYSLAEYNAKYTQQPQAWLSVFAARELLASSDANYFFKMDIDCVFVRTDVRLESLLDPLQRYSFYITNTESDSRFMQSQSWILKNSDYGKALINEWLDYVHWGKCGDLAYEQGAMHLMIGMAYSWHIGANGTHYTCPQFCTSLRSVFKHHHCVLDWLEDNGFGMSGSMNTHPQIHVYPYPNNGTSYSSPDDGFFMEWNRKTALSSAYHPLTTHPLKHHIYESPTEVLKYLRTFSGRRRR